MYKLLILSLFVAFAFCEPNEKEFEKCGEDFKCAEEKLISLVDELDSKPSLSLAGEVITVERTTVEMETSQNEGLYERVARYLDSHELKFNFPNNRAGRALMEGNNIFLFHNI